MKLTFTYLILSVALLLIITACGIKEPIDEYVEPTLTHTLKKVGEYEIPVDSMTATNFLHYQHYQEGEKEYFTLLNRITQEINFYDIKKKQLDFKIPVKFEGPHSVGNLQGFNSGYFIHNLDSIFLLNRTYGKLYLINSQSELINDYDILREKNLPSAVIAPFAPMIIDNGNAILLNIQSGMKHNARNKTYRSDYATSINLTTHESNYFLSYPEVYTEGTWGFDLHRNSWVFDKEKKRVIVSYALDENVHALNYDGRLNSTHPAKSKVVQKARSIKKKELNSAKGKEEYYFSQGKYGQLHFDPIRRIFIRDCIPGMSTEDRIANTRKLDRRLVLLDENLQKIGEVKEPKGGQLTFFFNEDGLHKFVNTRNENALKFEIFEYRKINN